MSKKNQGKKPYQKPQLKPFGSVKDLTKTSSSGGGNDGGSVPFDRMGNSGGGMCVSTPPLVHEHRNLIADTHCQQAFQKEIAKHVRPGDIVVDLGTGTGIHTLFALKAGAKKVYAIESGLTIHVAREVIAANGFADRVEFIHADSRFVELPERADVLISNIGFLYSIKYVSDAAARFLKPNGKMIPSGAQMSLVPYSDAQFYADNMSFWSKPHFGFDLSPVQRLAIYHPHYLNLKLEGVMAKAAVTPEIDFAKTLAEPVRFDGTFTMDQKGDVHGLAGWYAFRSVGVPFISTQPPMKLSPDIWSHFFLPLEKPITVQSGESLRYSVAIDFMSIENTALWFWTVETSAHETLKHSSLFSIGEPNIQN